MADHIYKKIEIIGSSSTSSDDAVRNALAKASTSVNDINWFEVTETRGQVEGDQVVHWQVTIKVGFRIKD